MCVCTLAYAQRRQAAVGDRLSYQLYLRERCTQTSTPSTHAHVSQLIPMKEVQKLLAEAPRGPAGFPPYNGGG